MDRKRTMVVSGHEVQVAERVDRDDQKAVRDRRFVTAAGYVTQERLTTLLFERLCAMLDADGVPLETATIYTAVAQLLSGVHETSGAADGATVPAGVADPRAQSALFARLGQICAEMALVPEAIVAYRRALRYGLKTNDPVTIGDIRGRLLRLSTQHQRRVRAAAKDVAAATDARHEQRRP